MSGGSCCPGPRTGVVGMRVYRSHRRGPDHGTVPATGTRNGRAMFDRGFHLFRLWGIPVELNVSWVLIFALVTWSFATGFIPQDYPGIFSALQTWILSVAIALLLFMSVLLHEFSHSIVAVRNGLPIRKITLFMFGGVAQMSREVDSPSLELRMASAGPLFSLFFAGLMRAAARLPGEPPFMRVLLVTVANANFGLFFFNMIPGFPLDGGRILRAAIWARSGDLRKATRVCARIGAGFGYLLMILGVWSFIEYGGMIGGLWMVFIGLFLKKAADDGYRNVAYAEALRQIRVRDIMRADVISVDGSIDLLTLVDDYFLRFHFNVFPVIAGDVLNGVVFFDDVRRIRRDEWPSLAVSDVMNTDLASWTVGEDESAGKLFFLIFQKGLSVVPVTGSDGRIAGMVTRRGFSDALKVMTSLVK